MPMRRDDNEPIKTVNDIEIAKAIIARDAVDCFIGKEQQTAEPQPTQLVSCTGGIFWGKPGEAWPHADDDDDDEPLIPWLQIVCTEMDRLFGAFHNRQAVCFYIRDDFSDFEAESTADGGGDFVVREYAIEDMLEPLPRPASLESEHPFRRVRWQRTADYPSLRKCNRLFDPAVYDALSEIENFGYANHSGIKIGGWPTPIQQEQQSPGACDLQIDTTEDFMFGDSGIGYLSRSGDQWYVQFDCC